MADPPAELTIEPGGPIAVGSRIEIDEGVFLLHQVPPNHGRGEQSGWIAIWKDAAANHLYLLDRLIRTDADVSVALLALDQQVGHYLDSLIQAAPELMNPQTALTGGAAAVQDVQWSPATYRSLEAMLTGNAKRQKEQRAGVRAGNTPDTLVVCDPLGCPQSAPADAQQIDEESDERDRSIVKEPVTRSDRTTTTVMVDALQAACCGGFGDGNPGGSCVGNCCGVICQPDPPIATCDGEWRCVNGLCHFQSVDYRICGSTPSACTTLRCEGGVCKPFPDGDPLTACDDDGNVCTLGHCDSGVCVDEEGLIDTACEDDDDNECTEGICRPISSTAGITAPYSVCVPFPVDDGTSCTDDGNECTDDWCMDGACDHPPVANELGCEDDGDSNTADICIAGACAHIDLGDSSSGGGGCNDGNPCTIDSLDNNGACVHTGMSDGSDCSDGNACTTGEVCVGGSCGGGTAVDCNDNNACSTELGCDLESGCVRQWLACDDGDGCTGDACDSNSGSCTFTPLNIDCNVGACEATGTPNTGEAVIYGPPQVSLALSGTAGCEMKLKVIHAITTHDTGRARDLPGKLTLSLVTGDPSVVEIRNQNALYTLGAPIPVLETGHQGCGLHNWHHGVEVFTVVPLKVGQVTLKAQVDPDPECCEGDGVPTAEDQITIKTYEVDLDVDSDNNNGNNLPDRTDAEDAVELSSPGKLLCVNDNDSDGNGTPDKDQEPPPFGDPDLVPMVAAVEFDAPAESRWKLVYDAPVVQVYKSDRSTIIPSGQVSTRALLPNPGTFWIEGLAPSAGTNIELMVDLDGDGTFECSDKVVVSTPSNYETVEIRYKTFIAPEVVVTPWNPKIDDFFAGDNRWFQYEGGSSRTYQSTSVTVDPRNEDGGKVGTPTNVFGQTRGYDDEPDGSDVTACPHCAGDFGDYCLLPDASVNCTMTAVAGQNGNVLDVVHNRISDSEVTVHFDVVATNPCASGIYGPDAPPIDAHLTIHLRQLCVDGVLQPMEFRLYGTHDGFPWHELYVNGTKVYDHDPCCTQETPWSLFGVGDHVYEASDLCHLQTPPLNEWRLVP